MEQEFDAALKTLSTSLSERTQTVSSSKVKKSAELGEKLLQDPETVIASIEKWLCCRSEFSNHNAPKGKKFLALLYVIDALIKKSLRSSSKDVNKKLISSFASRIQTWFQYIHEEEIEEEYQNFIIQLLDVWKQNVIFDSEFLTSCIAAIRPKRKLNPNGYEKPHKKLKHDSHLLSQTETSDLVNLPEELCQHIFSFLSPLPDLLILAQTCCKIRTLCLDDIMWKFVNLEPFPYFPRHTLSKYSPHWNHLVRFDAPWISTLEDSTLNVILKNARDTLEHLCLQGSPVTPNAFVDVTFPQLKKLDLGWCYKISGQCVAQLVTSCPLIETLSLQQCPLLEAPHLLAILEKCEKLVSLSLACCHSAWNSLPEASSNAKVALEIVDVSCFCIVAQVIQASFVDRLLNRYTSLKQIRYSGRRLEGRLHHSSSTQLLKPASVWISVAQSNYDLTKLLISLGEDVNYRGHLGKTPIIEALNENSKDMVTLLLSNGANPNSVAMDTSPLQAVHSWELVSSLLVAGATARTKYERRLIELLHIKTRLEEKHYTDAEAVEQLLRWLKTAPTTENQSTSYFRFQASLLLIQCIHQNKDWFAKFVCAKDLNRRNLLRATLNEDDFFQHHLAPYLTEATKKNLLMLLAEAGLTAQIPIVISKIE